jgi:hypothetical protein
VVDRALYAREDRDAMNRLVEGRGGRCVLVCFRARDREVLWRRVERRREAREREKDALGAGTRERDTAYVIEREVFDGWWEGFEWPDGEGEVIVEVD